MASTVTDSRVPSRSAADSGVMRAAVLAGPRRVELVERPLPQPGPGEVRVRLEGCGVCASNVPVWEGRDWFVYPRPAGSPGHEGWGIVDRVGADVRSIQPGMRVACLSYHAFAEYDLASASAVVPLPASLDGKAFPAEPLGCAINIFRRTGLVPGEPLAIIGCGFLGCLLIQLARAAGARVIAISRRNSSLEFARYCGAEHAVEMQSCGQRMADEVNRLAGVDGCSRVIEATGKQAGLDLATALVAERGRIVVAGFHQDGPRQVDMQTWNWRGVDVINAHERDPAVYAEGMAAARDQAAAGALDLRPLLTHRFTLPRLGEALDMAARRPEGFLKAYISMSS